MLSWSVFFLFNAAFVALIGISDLEGSSSVIAKFLAAMLLAVGFGILWIERRKRNPNF
jgi:uncharacterized membrane protein YtjA (UPF0391 family)